MLLQIHTVMPNMPSMMPYGNNVSKGTPILSVLRRSVVRVLSYYLLDMYHSVSSQTAVILSRDLDLPNGVRLRFNFVKKKAGLITHRRLLNACFIYERRVIRDKEYVLRVSADLKPA